MCLAHPRSRVETSLNTSNTHTHTRTMMTCVCGPRIGFPVPVRRVRSTSTVWYNCNTLLFSIGVIISTRKNSAHSFYHIINTCVLCLDGFKDSGFTAASMGYKYKLHIPVHQNRSLETNATLFDAYNNELLSFRVRSHGHRYNEPPSQLIQSLTIW